VVLQANETALADYAALQADIWATNRSMVLLTLLEGGPPVQTVAAGGYGNLRRIGHDISPQHTSMLSIVDIDSGLWPFAHNASAPWRHGWFNDADLIEVRSSVQVSGGPILKQQC
jgi:hypothetical protein